MVSILRLFCKKSIANHFLLGYGRRGGDSKTEALLELAHSIIKQKTKSKFVFYKSLVKPFYFDLKSTTSDEIDLSYLKFLSENILTLDFLAAREVLTVLYHIHRAIVMNGDDVLSNIEFLKNAGTIKEMEDESTMDDIESTVDEDFLMATKSAMSIIMLVHLKDVLVEVYDIPDE